ncbi:uncharacterized protein LOC127286705 [Leptopilina boulardi]|uniref:uncharacterized protein LOC127286705 n=1 Tax=Leptopilina boulardi TaxID=63433 RepID=UPI0021F56901|nr:uncharacterized protein LOC127286705 [Leptopilina boulardi]
MKILIICFLLYMFVTSETTLNDITTSNGLFRHLSKINSTVSRVKRNDMLIITIKKIFRTLQEARNACSYESEIKEVTYITWCTNLNDIKVTTDNPLLCNQTGFECKANF